MEKQSRKEPVIIDIEGTSFIVDVEKGHLQQTNDTNNIIPFGDMQDTGTHYIFSYNLDDKNIPGIFSDETRTREIEIPQMTALDPEGVAIKLGLPVDAVKNKSDLDLVIDAELLSRRLAGFLPEIDIAGNKYIADVRLMELRPLYEETFQVNPDPIRLKELPMSPDCESYVAFYNPVQRTIVKLDYQLTEYPEGVVMIQIPNELALDPIGVARSYDMEDKALLRKHPLQKDLTAKVVSLYETDLPRIIRMNREALQREHAAKRKSLNKGRGKRQ